MEDSKPTPTSFQPHRSIGRLLELYRITEPDGTELKLHFAFRKTILEIWQSQQRRGVPLYHEVRDDLVLIAYTTQGKRAVAEPSMEDFHGAVELVKGLPENAGAKRLKGLFTKLRLLGYKLILRDGKGTWRILATDQNRNAVGPMQSAFVRLAKGELIITRPKDSELKTGFGRILERSKTQDPESEPPPAPTKPHGDAPSTDTVSESLLVYHLQQAATVAEQLGTRRKILEYGPYVLRVDRSAYDEDPDLDAHSVPLLITPDSIHERLTALIEADEHETMDECIWSLLGARIPLTSDLFVKARKRFSTARSVAEERLYSTGCRPGAWHDKMALVPNTSHHSKTIHWIRRPT